MSKLSGTNLAAPIVPFTTDDKYATHCAEYGKGGWRSVEKLSDIPNIPSDRKEPGMAVYVTSTDKTYILDKYGNWRELVTSGSESKSESPTLIREQIPLNKLMTNPVYSVGFKVVRPGTLYDFIPVDGIFGVAMIPHDVVGQSGEAIELVQDSTLPFPNVGILSEGDTTFEGYPYRFASYCDLHEIMIASGEDVNWNDMMTQLNGSSICYGAYIYFKEDPRVVKDQYALGALNIMGSLIYIDQEIHITDVITGSKMICTVEYSPDSSATYGISFDMIRWRVVNELENDREDTEACYSYNGEKYYVVKVPMGDMGYGLEFTNDPDSYDGMLLMEEVFDSYQKVTDNSVNHFMFNVMNLGESTPLFISEMPIYWNNGVPPTFSRLTTVSILNYIGTYTELNGSIL